MIFIRNVTNILMQLFNIIKLKIPESKRRNNGTAGRLGGLIADRSYPVKSLKFDLKPI